MAQILVGTRRPVVVKKLALKIVKSFAIERMPTTSRGKYHETKQ